MQRHGDRHSSVRMPRSFTHSFFSLHGTERSPSTIKNHTQKPQKAPSEDIHHICCGKTCRAHIRRLPLQRIQPRSPDFVQRAAVEQATEGLVNPRPSTKGPPSRLSVRPRRAGLNPASGAGCAGAGGDGCALGTRCDAFLPQKHDKAVACVKERTTRTSRSHACVA